MAKERSRDLATPGTPGELSALRAVQAELERARAERQYAHESLREARQLSRAFLQASPLAIVIVDLDGRVTTWNPSAERLFGWTEGEVLGKRPPYIPFEQRDEFHSGLIATSQGEHLCGLETKRRCKDGTVVDVALWTAPLYDAHGAFFARLGMLTDISDRKRAEEQRTDLSRRLAGAQEEERRRIARELHDQMGQHLIALRLGLEHLAETSPGPDDHGRAARFEQLKQMVERMGEDVHRIALELRPTALDDLGLESALLNVLEEWSQRSGIEVDFHADGIDRYPPEPDMETAVYRVVREALTNVVKHARAGRVGLVLERRREQMLVIIEDDGVGFDVEPALGWRGNGRALGLLGMRERVTLIGGELVIESTPGKGTTLIVRIPICLENARESS
jgi:PAS domain S-box-containing protein